MRGDGKRLLVYGVVVAATVVAAYGVGGRLRRVSVGGVDVPSTRRVELPGGAVLLLKRVPGSPVVSLRCLIRTGSATEGRWTGTGISHLVEHMLFKGTDRYGVGGVSEALRRLGGQHNAYTSFDHTVFFVTVPRGGEGAAMEVLANAVLHSSFPAEELRKEQEVVLNEILRTRDRIESVFQDLVFRSAYDVHPYRHPVIGYADLLAGLTREDVVAYHRERYRPSNLVFAAAGDFDEAALVEAVRRELARFREVPYDAAAYAVPQEPVRLSPRYREVRRSDVRQTRLAVVWPGVAMRHSDMVALDLLALMLGGGRPSLLYRTLKDRRGLVEEVSAFSYTPLHPGIVAVSCQFDDSRFGEVTNALFRVLAGVERSLTARDLRRARNLLLAERVKELQTVEGVTAAMVTGEFYAGDPDFGAAYAEAVRRTTLEDVRRVARAYLRREVCTVAAVRPLSTVSTQTGRRPAVSGADLRIERKTLRSGLRIVYVHRPELPLVNLKFLVGGGLLLDTKPGLNRFVVEALGGGSRRYPGLAAFRRLEEVGGTLGFFAGNNSAGVTVEALSEHLALAASVLYETVRHPRFPKAKVGEVRRDLLAEAAKEEEDLFRQGLRELRALLFGEHPYRHGPVGTTASLSNITRKDLVEFHRRAYTAERSVLVVTGRFSEADRRRIERLFGGIPRGGGVAVGPTDPFAGAVVGREVRRPTEKARSLLLMAWPLPPLTNAERWRVEVADSLLSGLGGRLFARLRDVEHLGYSVGGFPVFLLDGGMYVFYVTTDAARLAQAERSLRREVDRLRAERPPQAETEEAKRELLGERMMRDQALDSLGLEVGLAELFYGDATLYRTWPDRVREVGPEEIRRTAARLFASAPAVVALRGTE